MITEITEQDDAPHVAGSDSAWSESYYFAFFGDGISGVSRIGNRPNEGTQDGLLVLFEPDGAVSIIRSKRAISANTGELSVGGFGYTCEDPLRRWRIRYSGPAYRLAQPRALLGEGNGGLAREEIDVQLDLTFTAVQPAAEIHVEGADAAAIMARVAPNHFEQSGLVEGTVLGRPFAGRGHRDKSWGVRDWGAPEMWRWFALPFGDDLAMNVTILRVGGQEIRGGWAWRDGELHGLTDVELETEFAPDGVTQRTFTLRATAGGDRLTIEGTVETVAPLPLPLPNGAAVANEGLASFRLGDGRTTVGIAEYLQRLDDSMHDALVRGAALQY
jgi:hypothetical protein